MKKKSKSEKTLFYNKNPELEFIGNMFLNTENKEKDDKIAENNPKQSKPKEFKLFEK